VIRTGIAAIAIALVTLAGCQPEVRRPLNPGPPSSGHAIAADRAFRIAFDAATAADFDTAAINYQRAFRAARGACHKAHARAGQSAALEAKAAFHSSGWQSKPTQLFWTRLQALTQHLPCVWIRES
jgi:hypothetical protein